MGDQVCGMYAVEPAFDHVLIHPMTEPELRCWTLIADVAITLSTIVLAFGESISSLFEYTSWPEEGNGPTSGEKGARVYHLQLRQ
jgi:hypothetical protein